MHARMLFAAGVLAVLPLTSALAQPQVQSQSPTPQTVQPPPVVPSQTTAQPPQKPTQPPPQPTQQGTPQPVPQPTAQQPVTQPGTVGTAGQLAAPAIGQQLMPQPVAACPQAPVDLDTALPLLDRVQRLLDGSIKGEMGKVSLDRATIDELRAEVAQIKAAIGPTKPQ